MKKITEILFIVLLIIIFCLGVLFYNTFNELNEREKNYYTFIYLDARVSSFAQAIEASASKQTNTAINFMSAIDQDIGVGVPTPYLKDIPEYKFRIENINDGRICNSRCLYQVESCFVLIFTAPKVPNAFFAHCLDIPTNTTFSTCSVKEGYILIDPTANIPTGNYTITNTTTDNNKSNTVCVYKKDD
jgi:hypothetical protein